MTILLLQAFLLMAASYFLGAFLGCWWRRAFANSPATAEISSTDAALASAGATVASKPAEVARAEPIPVQPRIEYVAAPEGVRDATRFGRALSGVGSLGEQKPKPETVDVKSEGAEPAPVAVTPVRIVVPPVVHTPAAVAPAAAGKSAAAAETTDTAMSAAAAAAAAMAAATSFKKAAAEAAAPAPVRPAAVAPATPADVPAAVQVTAPSTTQQRPVAASAGSSGVSAEVRSAPAVPTDRQDLKLIRGIDEVTERTLNSQGIWRFADIARWSAKHVAAANHLVAAKNRVQQENWIEQASLLAAGGWSDYARRRLKGEIVGARPTATPAPAKGPMRPMPASAPQVEAVRAPQARATPAASAAAAAAAVAAAAAAASRGIAAAGERKSAPVAAPQAQKPEPVAVKPQPPAPVTTVAVVPPVIAAVDMLQRVRGVDAATERTLVAAGVRTYGDIAKWNAEDVARFEMLIGEEGRIGRENWIEQAQILAGGGATHFSRQRDVGGVTGEAPAGDAGGGPRPSRLSEAIRDNQERGQRPVGRSDVAGLRSVRSEALRPGMTDGVKIGGTGRAQSDVDDLKRIRGIGVLIEKKLNSLGVMTYERIANWTADDIAHVSEALDFRGRIERENWVEQARILSAGGQTEFSRRVDKGEIT